jgi:hypothetical protein
MRLWIFRLAYKPIGIFVVRVARSLEAGMASDFAYARELLEHAWLKLSGDDETSIKSRQAIDILIEAITAAEHTMPRGQTQLVDFRQTARQP